VGRVDRPLLTTGTVLVQVAAATVNNTDVLLRSGAQRRFLTGLPPYIPGMDLAGTVLESADHRWAPGDRVMGAVSAWRAEGGAQSAVVRMAAASIVDTPPALSDVEAATLPMNGLTALAALQGLAVPVGGTIAVLGAAGAVGGLAVQAAVASGLHVIADAAPRDEVLVRGLGAETVVPRGSETWASILEAMPQGVDGLVDAVQLGSHAIRPIRDGGRIATLRPTPGLLLERDVTEVKVFVPDHLDDSVSLTRLSQLAQTGRISARVAEVFAAERVADAHRLLEAGGLRGRPVLDMTGLS
jgi:NADPH2:quinone reductase